MMHTCMLISTSWVYLIAHFGEADVSDRALPYVPSHRYPRDSITHTLTRSVAASIAVTVRRFVRTRVSSTHILNAGHFDVLHTLVRKFA